MEYEQRSFFSGQKARYPLFCIIGLFIFLSLITHDGQIYNAVETGLSDSNALENLYFPQWSNNDGTQLARGLFIGMLVLAGYAITIRVANYKRAEH